MPPFWPIYTHPDSVLEMAPEIGYAEPRLGPEKGTPGVVGCPRFLHDIPQIAERALGINGPSICGINAAREESISPYLYAP